MTNNDITKCMICGNALTRGDLDNICSLCNKDPEKILKFLLLEANKGNENLRGIANYKIIKELDRGGLGVVWLVEEESTHEQRALKMMLQKPNPLIASTKIKNRQRLLRAAYLGGQLKHKNVVRQYHNGEFDDIHYIVMEYCRGGNLVNLVKRKGGKLEIGLATHIILQVLDALEYIHTVRVQTTLGNSRVFNADGLVFRDLKPSNILMYDDSPYPDVKIADFGMAKPFETASLSGITFSDIYAGTLKFMARQQVRDFLHASKELDIWAAAACFYYMLTGSPPKDFSECKDDVDAERVAVQTSAIPIKKRNPSEIPDKLAAVIDAALVDDPNIGISSAVELKEAILAAN